MLPENEFRKLAEDELKSISRVLDGFTELTVDYGNEILTIEFDDGEKFVLNQQGPARQIWFAASFQAGHFDWDPAKRLWTDAKTGEALRTRVSRDLSKKLGKSVSV